MFAIWAADTDLVRKYSVCSETRYDQFWKEHWWGRYESSGPAFSVVMKSQDLLSIESLVTSHGIKPRERSAGLESPSWVIQLPKPCRAFKVPARSYPEVTCARPAFIEIIGVRPLTGIHHALGHYQDGPHFS